MAGRHAEGAIEQPLNLAGESGRRPGHLPVSRPAWGLCFTWKCQESGEAPGAEGLAPGPAPLGQRTDQALPATQSDSVLPTVSAQLGTRSKQQNLCLRSRHAHPVPASGEPQLLRHLHTRPCQERLGPRCFTAEICFQGGVRVLPGAGGRSAALPGHGCWTWTLLHQDPVCSSSACPGDRSASPQQGAMLCWRHSELQAQEGAPQVLLPTPMGNDTTRVEKAIPPSKPPRGSSLLPGTHAGERVLGSPHGPRAHLGSWVPTSTASGLPRKGMCARL